MMYTVDVRRIGGDSLPDLMVEMQTWLEQNGIEPAVLDHSSNTIGTAVRVGFRGQTEAMSFAHAFGGQLIGDDPGGAVLWQNQAAITPDARGP